MTYAILHRQVLQAGYWLSATSTIVALSLAVLPQAAIAQTPPILPLGQHPPITGLPKHPNAAIPSPPGQGTPIATGSGGSYFSPPSPPPNGAPGSNGTGASRGACVLGQTSLLALAPTYRQSDSGKAHTQVWGLTTAERPSIWFSVPPTNADAEMEFTLRDEANQVLHRQTVAMTKEASITSISLADLAQPLAVGKMYQWFFKIKCADSMQPPVYVNGWIQRTELDAATMTELEKASASQKAAIYAQKGIWYDAVTTLALLQPSQATADWQKLLNSVKLEAIASQPIVVPKPTK